MIWRLLFRDISLRCIRKSIDRLELIGKWVLWPIRFFVETNLISKKSTNPVCLCARQRLAHLHCQGPSWRLLTSNQSVKTSVPGPQPIRVSTLYICAHFVSISGVWAVGCIIYLCGQIHLYRMAPKIRRPFWSNSIRRNLNLGQKRLWWCLKSTV